MRKPVQKVITRRSVVRALPVYAGAMLALVMMGAAGATTVRAQMPDTARARARASCGTGIPIDEAHGFTPLPRGGVFCPLIADPKELGSFVSYLRSATTDFASDIGSVGIGDRFGIVRWGGRNADDGFQISLQGSVFAQFALNTPSADLLNADYIIGLPLAYRHGSFSMRARVYHQSSHLGDELLLRAKHPERQNLSYQAADVMLSQDMGPLRVYGGGEYLFGRDPSTLGATVAHGGAELRQTGHYLEIGRLGSVGLVMGTDVKASKEQEWKRSYSVRGGLEVGRPNDVGAPGRRWRLLGEYYNGPSPYGQFFLEKISYYGLGMHFSL